jgi:hypothetical protein
MRSSAPCLGLVAQLVTAVAALLVAAVFLYLKPINEVREATWIFLSLFASMVLIDRIGRLVVEHTAKKTKDETLQKLDETLEKQGETLQKQDETLEKQGETLQKQDETLRKLDETLQNLLEIPSLITKNNDVVVFTNRKAALEHCIAMAPKAVAVKNTVLRYGHNKSAPPNDTDSRNWRDAKKRSIKAGDRWMEIVSCYLDPTDDAMKFSVEMRSDGPRAYQVGFLDDRICAMMQMTIFDFGLGNGKEVLFGFGLPDDSLHGLTILTRNESVLGYFEEYWRAHWKKTTLDPMKWILSAGPKDLISS